MAPLSQKLTMEISEWVDRTINISTAIGEDYAMSFFYKQCGWSTQSHSLPCSFFQIANLPSRSTAVPYSKQSKLNHQALSPSDCSDQLG